MLTYLLIIGVVLHFHFANAIVCVCCFQLFECFIFRIVEFCGLLVLMTFIQNFDFVIINLW